MIPPSASIAEIALCRTFAQQFRESRKPLSAIVASARDPEPKRRMIKAGEFNLRQGMMPCHSRRLLSRGHPRGLFAFFGRGAGKLSAESFDEASTSSTRIQLTIRVLALLSSNAFNHLDRNSGFASLAEDYPRPRNLAQARHLDGKGWILFVEEVRELRHGDLHSSDYAAQSSSVERGMQGNGDGISSVTDEANMTALLTNLTIAELD
jgi:hypothetical protein